MVSTRQAVAAILRSAQTASVSKGPASRRSGTAGMLCLLTASLSWAPHALAQTAGASPAAAAEAQALDEVTVTGSRIKRTTDFTTPTPTTVIDSTQMENMGVVNVGQALSMTPANISNFTPANTGNSNFFQGAFIPDLRGLNPYFGSRTLTMIDSRRAVPTNQGDSFDLNFIPQVLVERIDTVTGGASAAYGSGAVAGVINVILDRKLDGGRFDADFDQTNRSDARDKHVSAAYGFGLVDNRFHVVLGGEYEKQDALGCQDVRSWCGADRGFYQTGTSAGNVALYSYGSNLRNNEVSNAGVLSAPFSFASPAFAPQYVYNPNALQLTPDGQSLTGYQGGVNPLPTTVNNTTVVGGDGRPIYQYNNLMPQVSRGVLTAMLDGQVTDTIHFSGDVNWGRVETYSSSGAATVQPFILPTLPQFLDQAIGYPGQNLVGNTASNGFATFPTMPNGYAQLAANNGNPALLNAINGGYNVLNKDWTGQVDAQTNQTTTVKRFSGGFDGKFGDSSWTWDAYGEYGLTNREQLVQNSARAISYEMATDSVLVGGTPECRVTAAGGGVAGLQAVDNPASPFYNPVAAATYGNVNTIATNGLLSAGCVPLNPFGTQAVPGNALAYSFGNLDERLRYTQTVAAVNASGDIFRGIGAGAFSLAAGFEWRQEQAHNDESYCDASDATCLARSKDFAAQYGNPFGGIVTVDEAYLEANLPLLKNMPFAHLLEIDVAGRESRYEDKEYYGLNLVQDPGAPTEDSHDLTTWKVSALYEPVQGVRFRGSQSRDSRAPNFRELYYGQQLESTANGGFGSCSLPNSPPTASDPCTWNLLGNTSLRPETSDTTTLGVVLTPPQVPGLAASVDWFHIKIKDSIEQAAVAQVEQNCAAGDNTSCSQIVFNDLSYDAATGAIVAPGTPGSVTGAAAWQQGNGKILNAVTINATSYNGALYDERGVDLSLSYLAMLPDGSSLTSRILSTWTGEQVFQAYAGGPSVSVLGQTGAANNFLNDSNPAARWTGNMSLTWQKGGFSLTPNVRFVGEGSLSYLGVTPTSNASLYQEILAGLPDSSNPASPNYKQELAAKKYGFVALPYNHVGSYFVFGLNAAYSFENLPGLKSLQLFTQVDNLLNRAPPFAAVPGGFNSNYGGTNPVFFDTLGLRYRVGFRMAF